MKSKLLLGIINFISCIIVSVATAYVSIGMIAQAGFNIFDWSDVYKTGFAIIYTLVTIDWWNSEVKNND